MPSSLVDLCATALLKIGARPIASLDEATSEAECARRLYPVVRDALLTVHPWSFTLAQAELTAEAAPPLADFAHAFALPPDHLRTISVGTGGRGRGLVYRVQGMLILTDAESITLTYQRRAPEEEFPAFFVQLLVTRLAAEFCVPLTEGTSRALELHRLAEAELRLARLVDSQQATPQRVDDFSLIAARQS